jgi:phage shock protein B
MDNDVAIILAGTFSLMSMTAMLVLGIFGIRWALGRTRTEAHQSEARLIQELHHVATQMERRVEALETLLLEKRERTPEHTGRH